MSRISFRNVSRSGRAIPEVGSVVVLSCVRDAFRWGCVGVYEMLLCFSRIWNGISWRVKTALHCLHRILNMVAIIVDGFSSWQGVCKAEVEFEEERSCEKSLREMSSRTFESWKTDGNSVVLLRKVHGYICMWRLRAVRKW